MFKENGEEYLGSISMSELGDMVQVVLSTDSSGRFILFSEQPEWLNQAIRDKNIIVKFGDYTTTVKVLEEDGYKEAVPTDRIIKWRVGGFSVFPEGCFFEN